MPVTTKWYTNGPKALIDGVSWTGGTIKVALVNAYVFNQDTHTSFTDVAATALGTANGHTARGLALTARTVTTDAATNQTRLDAADPSWTAGAGQTLSATGAVIYNDTGVNSTSLLLGYINFDATLSATGAAFTIQLDPTGALRLTAAA